MSVETQRPKKHFTPEAVSTYRAVSKLAVVSLLLGLISPLAALDWAMAIVPWSAIVTGVTAWQTIRSRQDSLTGLVLAKAGVLLALVFWSGGWSWLAIEYATEVPAGYRRLTFDELQPLETTPAESSQTELTLPAAVRELDGQRVFIKGYVLPGRQTHGIKQFLLVWSNGDCCFGGNPPLTHTIEVTLDDRLALNYSPRLTKVAGMFRVNPGATADGLAVLYRLEADYLQ
jgi:hypothetical protein